MDIKSLTHTYLVTFESLGECRIIEEFTSQESGKKIFVEKSNTSLVESDLFLAIARLTEFILYPQTISMSSYAGIIGYAGNMPSKQEKMEKAKGVIQEFDRANLPLLIGFFKSEEMQEALAIVLRG